MYKLLILDDEYLVRRGLIQTIDWESMNIEIVGEATNGQMGLELVHKFNPDIIISDVKMPIMDGLQFVKALKKENIDTICIMLSGYKDFDFAKDTLENGAFSYLLKPIDVERLKDMVQKAIQELEKRRKEKSIMNSIVTDLPLIKNTIIQRLVSGNYEDIEEIVNKNNLYRLNIPTSGVVIYGKIDNASNQNESEKVKVATHILSQLILKKLPIDSVSNIHYSHFIILSKEIPSKKLMGEVVKEFEELSEQIISVGISNVYNDYSQIYNRYLEVKKVLKNKVYLTLPTVTYGEDNIGNYRKVVIETIKYVSKNYMYNFDINTVSNDLNVSGSHLMHSFKEDVGKTINEFLNEYRIEVAKHLMNQGKYKIYEVAEKVGINDSKYFSQVFKKVTGVTPATYLSKGD